MAIKMPSAAQHRLKKKAACAAPAISQRHRQHLFAKRNQVRAEDAESADLLGAARALKLLLVPALAAQRAVAATGAGLGSGLRGALQQGQDLGLGGGSDQGDQGEVLGEATLVQLRVVVAVVALLAGDLGQDAAVVGVGEEDARGGVQQAVEAVLPLGRALALGFVSFCSARSGSWLALTTLCM